MRTRACKNKVARQKSTWQLRHLGEHTRHDLLRREDLLGVLVLHLDTYATGCRVLAEAFGRKDGVGVEYLVKRAKIKRQGGFIVKQIIAQVLRRFLDEAFGWGGGGAHRSRVIAWGEGLRLGYT